MNYQQLSRTESDVTVNDLGEISKTIGMALRDDDTTSQRELSVAFDRSGGILSRLLPPSKVERARQDLAVRGMKEQAARRAAMMEIYTETRLEIARKQADTLIASVGISLQNSLASFAAEQVFQLHATITEMRNRFMESYGPAADQIELHQGRPELYIRAKEQLNCQLDMQFETMNKLLSGFVKSLSGRVVR
ncbi:MAG: hypothetical protein M0019_00410 [Actinomycetota bacterium]|nr:hypothetical protein [Actinomycetota bacterium]